MIDGNTAAALGCVYAGATVGAWYPITPSTSLMDAFKGFCERFRKDPKTGEKLYCIVQAEDELAAIGIVLGASWNGARAFTPTSGPGLSLMNEFLGFAYFAELPAVVFDIQRVGPSTGMPTRTQQARHPVGRVRLARRHEARLLFPSDPRECFEVAVQAFDLAERLQTPVIVLSDLDIGMNDWMCKELEWDPRLSAGSRQGAERGAARRNQGVPSLCRRRRRRNPVPHAARRASEGRVFRARLGSQRSSALYTEDSAEYQQVVDRLTRKWRTAAQLVPKPIVRRAAKAAKWGLIGDRQLGRRDTRGARPARAGGIHVDYCRIRAYPFGRRSGASSSSSTSGSSSSSRTATRSSRACSRSSSVAILRALHSILQYGGLPIDCRCIVDDAREAWPARGEAA